MVVKVNFENGIAVISMVSMDTSERDALTQPALSAKQLLPSSNKMNAVLNLCRSATDADILKDPYSFMNNFSNYKPEYPNLDKTGCKKYKNTTDETSDSTQEVFAGKVDALSTLYKELERAERCYGKYTHLLNILKDIKTDAYISDDERCVIDTKIKIYEDKVSELKTAHEKLIIAILDI